MKKTIYTILVLISFIMLMSESDNFMLQVIWTSSALLIFWFAGSKLQTILEKEDNNG